MEAWLQGNFLDWWAWRARTVQHGTIAFTSPYQMHSPIDVLGIFPQSHKSQDYSGAFWTLLSFEMVTVYLDSSNQVTGYHPQLTDTAFQQVLREPRKNKIADSSSHSIPSLLSLLPYLKLISKMQLSISQVKSEWETSWISKGQWHILMYTQCPLWWLQFSIVNGILRILYIRKFQRKGERTHQLLHCTYDCTVLMSLLSVSYCV